MSDTDGRSPSGSSPNQHGRSETLEGATSIGNDSSSAEVARSQSSSSDNIASASAPARLSNSLGGVTIDADLFRDTCPGACYAIVRRAIFLTIRGARAATCADVPTRSSDGARQGSTRGHHPPCRRGGAHGRFGATSSRTTFPEVVRACPVRRTDPAWSLRQAGARGAPSCGESVSKVQGPGGNLGREQRCAAPSRLSPFDEPETCSELAEAGRIPSSFIRTGGRLEESASVER